MRRSDKSHGLNVYADVFGIGDTIAVYRGKTMEEKARFTVENVKITGEWTIELTVDKPTDGLACDDLIENLSTNPEVVIKNTRFAKSNGHLRLQTRNRSVVEKCTFTLPFMLTGDTNYWFESSPVNNLTIKNCKFIGKRANIRIIPDFTPTQDAPFYHRGITIANNSFECEAPLYANCAQDIVFSNNRVVGGKEPKFELHDCINVLIH